MEAKELRIGNYIQYETHDSINPEFKGKMLIVDIELLKDVETSILYSVDKIYTGIPPTPEILERAGFSKWNKEDDYWMDGRCEVVVDSNYNLYLFCETDGSKWFVSRIKSLHQFQNLYYALTGIELTINIDNSKTVEK